MIAARGLAPMNCTTTSPSTNSASVGMPITRYFEVVIGFASTSSETTRSRSASSVAIRASTGAIITHGGHQVAVKSTSTGIGLASTSCAKASSVVVSSDMASPDGCFTPDGASGLTVDLGDQPSTRIGLLAAFALQFDADPAAATAVPVDDLG